MSCINDMDAVNEEIKELILHSKMKKLTITEPCNEENIAKYLTAIQEELSLLGFNFFFDSHSLDFMDAPPSSVQQTVRLTNALWGLLRRHKDAETQTRIIKDRNYSLEQNNFYLNNLVDKMKRAAELSESKLRESQEAQRRLVLKLEASQRDTAQANEDLKRCKKQQASKERQLTTELKRHERGYEQLQDKFRGQHGLYTSKNEAKSSFVEEYALREKKSKEMIARLQETNGRLVQELVTLRDELLAEEEEED